jgi:hypothetical protein
MMAVLRHLVGSDPSIAVSDEEIAAGVAVTLHFEARHPKPSHSIEQNTPSIVISNTPLGKHLGNAAEVTHITRPRGMARWFSLNTWIILLESHWVFIALGLSVLALLICTAKLHGAPRIIP